MSVPWPNVRLGEVLAHNQSYIVAPEPKIYRKLSVKLYGRGVVLDAPVDGATLKMKRHQLAKAGQVILSEIWGKKGAIGFVPTDGEGALCTSHFFLFDLCEDKCDPRWLRAIFDANYLQRQLDSEAKGTTGYAAVRPKILLSCEIPLPPLPEQQRIVARIEAVTRRVTEATKLRQEAVTATNALLASAISALSLGEHSWKRVADAILERKNSVRSGPFGSQLLHEEFVNEGIAAIGTRDVQTNHFDLRSGWFVTPDKFDQLRRYQVFPGDVLCTIVGASIGRFCVVPTTIPVAFTTKHIQALTLDRNMAQPSFVSLMLNFHRRCRASLFSQVEGSAQPSLNAAKILATALPLPPLSEQRRIVADLERLERQLRSLRQLQSDTAAKLNALPPAILDRAFKGEL